MIYLKKHNIGYEIFKLKCLLVILLILLIINIYTELSLMTNMLVAFFNAMK